MAYVLNNFTILSNWRYLFYALDIFMVAGLLYLLYLLIYNTKAYAIALGILFIFFITVLARILGFTTVTWIFDRFFQIGLISMVILFKSEIKHGLRLLGASTFFSKSLGYKQTHIQKVVLASSSLASRGFGALIIFERKIPLNNYTESAIKLDAKLSSELIETIFYKNNPIHDGAIVIAQDRIIAASVYLPLTEVEPEVSTKRLGTRHRAALGITEHSDCVVLVVSEETSSISIAHSGILLYNVPIEELNEKLNDLLEIK